VPENLVVSTLVAANYVSTLVLESISSIFTLGDINIQANNVTTQGVNVSMIDPGGAGVSVVGGLTSIKGSPSVTVEGDLSVSTITNLSSINGQPYNYYPGASAVSSISRAGGLVEVNSDGSITAASAAAATIQLDSLGQIALATSISTGTEQMSLAAASTIYISSGSLVQMTSELSVPAITNVSTINNSVYPPPPYVLPENLTVSSLAAFNLSTVNLNVSTINGAPYIPANSIIPYTLSGTTAGAVIVNKGTGATSSLTQNVFISTSQITFNLPAVLNATESIYYDGYSFNDFDANFNSFWGVSYYTNTVSTPTDILGSTSATANALNFPNNQQVYVPLNLIIPPTNITAGGTVTLTLFCNATSANHYLIAAPINTARIGVVSD
jgi:hypothetical protein